MTYEKDEFSEKEFNFLGRTVIFNSTTYCHNGWVFYYKKKVINFIDFNGYKFKLHAVKNRSKQTDNEEESQNEYSLICRSNDMEIEVDVRPEDISFKKVELDIFPRSTVIRMTGF